MNKWSYILFSGVIINAILGVFFFSLFVEDEPVSRLRPVNDYQQQIQPPISKGVYPLIEEINRTNSRIQSFSSDKIEAKLWNGRMRVKLRGTIKYQKPKNSRMILTSILGTEADVGSNEEIFWYWSKRDKTKSLKYARHEDVLEAGLKTGLNPSLIMESLGLDQINTRDAKVVDQGDVLAIIKTEYSSTEKFYHTTFIDKRIKKIKGFVISDMNNKPIITSEISWKNELPYKNLINWHSEGKTASIEYIQSNVNFNIPRKWWKVPNYRPQENLAR